MSNYVVLKLITGDQVIAELLNETHDGVVLLNPIRVRTVPTPGSSLSEQALATQYCQFTDETQFTFDYRNIVYCKKLSERLVAYYKRIVNEFDNTIIDPRDEPEDQYSDLDKILENVKKDIKFH